MASNSNSKYKKACEAMRVFGYSEKVVKPVLKNLLTVYDKNWELIEDENYSVLLEAIMESEESKVRQKSLLEDEPQENEPPPKRSRFPSQGNHSSSAKHDLSSSADTRTSELQPSGKKKMAEFTTKSYETQNVELKTPSRLNHCKHKGKKPSSSEGFPVPEEDNDSVVLSDDGIKGALVKYDSSDVTPLNVPLSDDLPGFDGPLAVIPSGIEKQDLEYLNSEHLDIEGNRDDATNSSLLDIASSPNGEVKISFVYEPHSSDFHPPSLDAVLKQMEEKYMKSYRVSRPGFSLLRLMENLCECYLIASTKSREANEASVVKYDATNHKLHLASDISNGSFKLSNFVKVLPQIPKFPASENRDIMCYMVDFNGTRINGAEKDKPNKVLKLLESSSTLNNSVVVQNEHSSRGRPNSVYFLEDISNGREERRISLINEFSDVRPVFTYISKNVIFQNAYVKFVLARISDDDCCSNCSGDCLSQDIPCACAGETGGEFAYTSGGLLKEKFLESCIAMNRDPQSHVSVYCQDCPLERSKSNSMSGPCKGHLVRKFIKECWHKCGCSRGCGNRIVQRGIAVPLQVFMTADGKGWGLRVLEDLPRGAFVCEYVGEIVTNTELYERNMQTADERHTYPVLLDADWGSEGVLKDEEALCLDATSYGNVARFINHRCYEGNLISIPVEVESPDHHYYHVAFFTVQKVKAFEELTWDYGIDFADHSHPVKAFKCCCGSKFCRDSRNQPLKRARK